MRSVPFSNAALGGLGVCSGLLHREPEELVIEFQVKESLLGLLPAKLQVVRIPLAELVTVDLSRGFNANVMWISTRIVIQVARLETIQDFPDTEHGRIELFIPRDYRQDASELLEELYRDMEAEESDQSPQQQAAN